MDASKIEMFLAEVGPLLEAVEIVGLTEPTRWEILFDEEPPYQIDPSKRAGHLVLSSPVWPLPEDGRSKLYEVLMLYNDRGTETGGVRMSLNKPDGLIIMAVDLTERDLEPQHFSDLLAQFRDTRAGWQAALENREAGKGPEDPAGQHSFAIRV